MPQYDLEDFEDLEEVSTEKIKRSGSRKPKKSWKEINKAKERKLAKKVLTKKRKNSEKMMNIEEDYE